MTFVQDLSTDLKEPSQDERAPAFIWRYVLTIPALIEPYFPPKTALFITGIQMEVIRVSLDHVSLLGDTVFSDVHKHSVMVGDNRFSTIINMD